MPGDRIEVVGKALLAVQPRLARALPGEGRRKSERPKVIARELLVHRKCAAQRPEHTVDLAPAHQPPPAGVAGRHGRAGPEEAAPRDPANLAFRVLRLRRRFWNW